MPEKQFLRKIRSFVRRDRMTEAQEKAFGLHWGRFGLEMTETPIVFSDIFHNNHPCILEIGFGFGHSLLAMAKEHLDKNFIGIETHKPGIGSVLHEIVAQNIHNIRLFYGDAVEVLEKAIPNHSLDTIQIFFPDPWPKRKHHKRRLIQTEFVTKLISKLKIEGTLHIATDWEEYAVHIMKTLSAMSLLKNLAGAQQFAHRSLHRPTLTKFEKQGLHAGRTIWELQFAKIISPE